MFPLIAPQQAVWAANGISRVDLSPFLQQVEGQPMHLVCIDLKVAITVTPDAVNDTPGIELPNVISRFILRDVLSNDVANIRGRHIRDLVWAATGWRHPDAADIAGGGDQAVHVFYLRIPFHGGEKGLYGFADYKDCIQPMDRFREQTLEIHWSAADQLSQGTIDACTMDIQFRCFPYPTVIQGADIRYSFVDHADAQIVDFPVSGRAFHTAIFMNDDRDHSDYTVITVPDFSYLTQIAPWQLVQAWNEACATDVAQQITGATPEFIPVIYQDPKYGVLGTISFTGGKMTTRTTNTNATTQVLGMVEVHDTDELSRRIMGRRGTVYEPTRVQKPSFSKKNRASVDPRRQARLDVILGRKLKNAKGSRQ